MIALQFHLALFLISWELCLLSCEGFLGDDTIQSCTPGRHFFFKYWIGRVKKAPLIMIMADLLHRLDRVSYFIKHFQTKCHGTHSAQLHICTTKLYNYISIVKLR